jgi:hypothetical protein
LTFHKNKDILEIGFNSLHYVLPLIEVFMDTELALQTRPNEVADLIEQTDNMYLSVLYNLGLPTEGVLSTLKERKSALKNFPDVISGLKNLDETQYLSKFLVAISTGLFDAALNYLWDETIKQLRVRVLASDFKYFYDIVIPDVKRKDFSSPEDLLKLDDSTLIEGALKIGLISQIGYKHLDYIRYMRNWASAAHPNQTKLTGLNLVSWLETCVREVIATPLSSIHIKTNKLLGNIKAHIIDKSEAEEIASFFTDLSAEECNALAKGFFGIYIDPSSKQQTIDNISLIAPFLWNFVSEDTRSDFGIRYAYFTATGEKHSKEMSRRFLELTGGLSYLPDLVKTPQIKSVIDRLLEAHLAFNNFYNEPPIARELLSIVGSHGTIPAQLNYQYIRTVVIVFLTNGNGEVWNANPTYEELIANFDSKQSYLALTAFREELVRSRLQFPLCKKKYKELLSLIEPHITSGGVKSLMADIKNNLDSLSTITKDSKLMKIVEQYDKNYANY